MQDIIEGNGSNQCEVTFRFNKYNKPELLDLKTSIANTICNALFMVPGNNPSRPLDGVNIRQYFYKQEDEVSGEEIRRKLDTTCGHLPGGALISNVDISVQTASDGTAVFLLIIRLAIAQQDTLLGIALRRSSDNGNTTSDDRDVVNFNFDYVDI